MYSYRRWQIGSDALLGCVNVYSFAGKIIHGANDEEIRVLKNIIKDMEEGGIVDLTELDKTDSLFVSLLFRGLKDHQNILFVLKKDSDVHRAIDDWYMGKKDTEKLPKRRFAFGFHWMLGDNNVIDWIDFITRRLK